MTILAKNVKSVKRFSFTAPPPCKVFSSVQDKENFLLDFDSEVARRVQLLKKRIPTQYLDNVYDSMFNFLLGGCGNASMPEIVDALDYFVLYTKYPKTIQWCDEPYYPDLTLTSGCSQIQESFQRGKSLQSNLHFYFNYSRDNNAHQFARNPHQFAIDHARNVETIGHELGLPVLRCKRMIGKVVNIAQRLEKRFLDNESLKRNLNLPDHRTPVNIHESRRKDRIRRNSTNIKACQRKAIQCLENGGVVLSITVRLPNTLHAKKRLAHCFPYAPYLDISVFVKVDLLHDIRSSALKLTVKNRSPRTLGIGGLWRLENHQDGTPHLHMLVCFPDANMADRYAQNLHKSYSQVTEPFRYVNMITENGEEDVLLDVEVKGKKVKGKNGAKHDAIQIDLLPGIDDIMRNASYVLKKTDDRFPDLLLKNHQRRYDTFGTFRKAPPARRCQPENTTTVPDTQGQRQGIKNAREGTIFGQASHAHVHTDKPAVRPFRQVYKQPAPPTAYADVGRPWALPSSVAEMPDRNLDFIAILHREASKRSPIFLPTWDFLPNIGNCRYLRPEPRAPPVFIMPF